MIPALVAIAALLLPLPFLGVAPNRLLPGEGVSAIAALGAWVAVPVALLALGAWRRLPGWAGAASAGLAVLALLALAGMAAGERLAGLAPAARASLGAGFWLAMAGALALLAMRGAWMGVAVAAGAALLLAGGWLDHLSLVVEGHARAEALRGAVLTHLALAGAALGLALLVAVPLAWAGFRRPRLRAALGAALAGVQVVPAIALFALLIPLLAALLRAVPALRDLGLGAVGWLPAVLATAAYLALPLWRSVSGGLASADPAAVQAAEAMGMTEGRILAEVRLPLALPVFAGGLRVAVVQAIGLVTLGGLVGAGGLGALVFEGLAQFATDLMLLGALPIMALALAADTLARAAETRLGRPA
ncbi:ABC transporter permease subunit [Falsiroseomonas ponticola]|uniref:ABC transporter permease subunit n=1 Tax=Falsiroseomonas ponticola TaxID=2786951 RepID=UPI00193164E3|nr:ABC transporter permease subunit [Roseomonas ponticola]